MLAVIDETRGFISQKEGRIMSYTIKKDGNKVKSTPLHFEKGNKSPIFTKFL